MDFVLAYPQADVEGTIFMKLPKGVELDGKETSKTHMLQLLKNIYCLKQSGRVWKRHLHRGQIDLGYAQSKIDPCLYYKGY